MVATVITLVPNARSSTRPQGYAPGSPPSLARGSEGAPRPEGSCLRSFAVEPTGEGPYVEAVREWIEQVTPRSATRPALYLVR
jgi:hypothetical protein